MVIFDQSYKNGNIWSIQFFGLIGQLWDFQLSTNTSLQAVKELKERGFHLDIAKMEINDFREILEFIRINPLSYFENGSIFLKDF